MSAWRFHRASPSARLLVRKSFSATRSASILVTVLLLTGCGSSSTDVSNGDAVANDYTPSAGAFAAVPAPASDGVAAVNTCNLDAVNGKPAGSAPLPHGSTATFTGWVADTASGKVPPGVQLVLQGAKSYAVNAATGLPRPDVVAATRLRSGVNPGYSVRADLSAVTPGTYTPVLEFSVGGKHFDCSTAHALTIQ